jgi:hypothetical protein
MSPPVTTSAAASPAHPSAGGIAYPGTGAAAVSSSDHRLTIREDVLRDPRYPVHQIADRLLPYLRVLVEQFHPQQVILFGSYAYGQPDRHSDVDLLVVVKEIVTSAFQDKLAIRAAWWPILIGHSPLSFDLLLADTAEHAQRSQRGGAYYQEITTRGLRLV